MSKLDDFVPDGIPIHPYDFYELLNSRVGGLDSIVQVAHSPRPEDEADYWRNAGKGGDIVEVDGVRYFQTTNVPAKTKLIV